MRQSSVDIITVQWEED